MKKIIALIISATMLLSLSACNKGKGTPASSNATTKAAAAGEGADGNTDATKKNTDAGAIVLLPGELYQFDKDADGGPQCEGSGRKGHKMHFPVERVGRVLS